MLYIFFLVSKNITVIQLAQSIINNNKAIQNVVLNRHLGHNVQITMKFRFHYFSRNFDPFELKIFLIVKDK